MAGIFENIEWPDLAGATVVGISQVGGLTGSFFSGARIVASTLEGGLATGTSRNIADAMLAFSNNLAKDISGSNVNLPMLGDKGTLQL